MTEYNMTNWEFDNVKENEYKLPEAGLKTMLIKKATYNPDTTEYSVTMLDVDNDVEFTIRYWLKYVDRDTGNFKVSNSAEQSMVSLGKALYGKVVGIRPPCDIEGKVVCGEVEIGKSKKGTEYATIKKYCPAPRSVVECVADADKQFCVDD